MAGSHASNILPYLESALLARESLLQAHSLGAFRLFNGFYEGAPDLVADLYAGTLVLYSYSKAPSLSQELISTAQTFYLQAIPNLVCVLHKWRYSDQPGLRRGIISHGMDPAAMIEEYGVRYALDLRLNQDASFYPDTRYLRRWLLENSQDQNVLNMFAYTGSLGVASLAGGALSVTQVDLNRKFLDLAQRSVLLNDLNLQQMRLQASDFFSQVAYHKRQGTLFDLVILDAPFFSSTKKGRLDLAGETARLVNKLRPLVADGGRLVVVNNALFLSGKDFLSQVDALCQDGYLSIQKRINIPEDISGYPGTIQRQPPVDPAPFNHPTKIVILGVVRK